jgi:hypothetical protein
LSPVVQGHLGLGKKKILITYFLIKDRGQKRKTMLQRWLLAKTTATMLSAATFLKDELLRKGVQAGVVVHNCNTVLGGRGRISNLGLAWTTKQAPVTKKRWGVRFKCYSKYVRTPNPAGLTLLHHGYSQSFLIQSNKSRAARHYLKPRLQIRQSTVCSQRAPSCVKLTLKVILNKLLLPNSTKTQGPNDSGSLIISTLLNLMVGQSCLHLLARLSSNSLCFS